MIREGEVVTDLFQRAMRREKVRIGGKNHDAVWLLAKFVSLTLQDFEEISQITFAVPYTDIDVSKMLKGIGSFAGVPKECVNVQDYKEKTGKGAIGCFPIYTPEPLVHAAGYLPVGVWASHQESELVKQYFPAFACPIMASNLELGLRGKFDCLSAVIIPCMCDTLICTGQNWKRAIPQVPYIGFVHPRTEK